MAKEVWFVRHAESYTNAGLDWHDQETNPITEKGHRQARLVCEALVTKPSLIVTSPFIRTKLTAAPTIERWPDIPHEEWQVQEYTQICTQTRGMVSRAECITIFKEQRKIADPDHTDGPKAESFNNMVSRVEKAIEKIRSTSHKKILIFSHGFFLSALFYRLENPDLSPVPMHDLIQYKRHQSIPNTAVIQCSFEPNGLGKINSASVKHIPDLEWEI